MNKETKTIDKETQELINKATQETAFNMLRELTSLIHVVSFNANIDNEKLNLIPEIALKSYIQKMQAKYLSNTEIKK